MSKTSNLRIQAIKPLVTPDELVAEIPLTEQTAEVVTESRSAIHRILHEMDDRLLVVMGPCSIHDPKAGLEYAQRLLEQRKRYAKERDVPAFVVFSDKTLRDLANKNPATLSDLLNVYGMGPAKLELFGHDLLKELGRMN